VSGGVVTRPARKADATDIALLVNVATHGAIARGWANGEGADEAYDPIEIGRLEMLEDDDSFNWRNATMAETADGEVTGMLLGYREPESLRKVAPGTPDFLVPILELEYAAVGTWFVSMLGVHIRWRSKGVGSALLDIADTKRQSSHAQGVSLIVEDTNAGARRLYQRRGFAVRDQRPMGRYPGSDAPGGNWLLMVKE
jgi:ribosomal protein S18 acetylase RimI-like enzyme